MAKISLDMTVEDHYESFRTKFELTSLLAIFQFWSTFWLKWAKISLDMTIGDYYESFRAKFEPTSLFAIHYF